MVSITEKKCLCCGETKPASEFYDDRKRRDGKEPYCRTCCCKKTKEYTRKNLAKVRRAGRDYYWNVRRHIPKTEAEKERAREYQRARYWAFPEKYRDANAACARRHPARAGAQNEKRRALRNGAEGIVTVAEWQALCFRAGGVCPACGEEVDDLTMDHVVPLSRGGQHTIDNIQPLCKACNSRKHTKTVDYRGALTRGKRIG